MTDTVNEPECDEAVSQQAQGPALSAFRRRATGKRNKVGFPSPVIFLGARGGSGLS
jgi:hypothetical protein